MVLQDVKWLQTITKLPILVKGVITAEDSEYFPPQTQSHVKCKVALTALLGNSPISSLVPLQPSLLFKAEQRVSSSQTTAPVSWTTFLQRSQLLRRLA
jgi:hypothetical protein